MSSSRSGGSGRNPNFLLPPFLGATPDYVQTSYSSDSTLVSSYSVLSFVSFSSSRAMDSYSVNVRSRISSSDSQLWTISSSTMRDLILRGYSLLENPTPYM